MHMSRSRAMFLIDDGRVFNIIEIFLNFLIFAPSLTRTLIDDMSVTNFVQSNIGSHVLHALFDYTRTRPIHWIGSISYLLTSLSFQPEVAITTIQVVIHDLAILFGKSQYTLFGPRPCETRYFGFQDDARNTRHESSFSSLKGAPLGTNETLSHVTFA